MSKLMKTLGGIIRFSRRTGMTTAIANAAKSTGGVVICHSARWASEVSRVHGVEAVSIHRAQKLRGRRVDMYLDGECMQQLHAMANDLSSQLDSAKKIAASRGRALYLIGIEDDTALDIDALVDGENDLEFVIDELKSEVERLRTIAVLSS